VSIVAERSAALVSERTEQSSPLLRRVIAGRCCPACGERKCTDPADCLWFLTSRPWGACLDCAGTGWADESDPLNIFCPSCEGTGLVEYFPGAELAPDQITDASTARHAAHVARLEEESR